MNDNSEEQNAEYIQVIEDLRQKLNLQEEEQKACEYKLKIS